MVKSLPKHAFYEGPLLFAILLDMVGFGMVLPDIQTRLERFGASGWQIGAVFAAYFLVQMLASPLWGRVSDHRGRKPVLMVCGALSAVSLLLYGLADSAALILLSRVLAGLGGANVVAAQAYLADTTTGERRTAAMGQVGSATTAGLVLGPVIGGLLASLGGHWLLGVVAACASAFGVVWIALGVPKAVPRSLSPAADRKRPVFDFSLLRELPGIRALLVMAGVSFFALACLEGTFGRLIHHKLGYGAREFGLIFGYEALLSVLVQSLLLASLSRRLSSRALLRLAFLLQGVGLGITPFMPNLPALFAASTFYAVGAGIAGPTLNSLCSKATPEPRQGEMFGLLQAARSFAFLGGPILGGVLFDWHPEAPYLLAGVVALSIGVSAQSWYSWYSWPVSFGTETQ